jgi:putative transposase
MSHTYIQNAIHVVFSTKGRAKTIPKSWELRVWAYLSGICRNHGIFSYAVGGTEDHIHLLVEVPANLSVARAVSTIKSNSSRWANERGLTFAWQQGYAAFSVSASIIPAVVRYIENQEAHHKKMSFDDELVAMLRKHGVEYDPKFVFG